MSCNAVYTDGGDTDAILDSEREGEKILLLNRYTNDRLTRLSKSNQISEKLYEHDPNGSDTAGAVVQTNEDTGSGYTLNLLDLPSDIQIKCFSFLYPKDVLKFSCVNCVAYDTVSNENVHADIPRENSVSNLLWYQLFLRDYASILTQWHAGVKAVKRSKSGGMIGCEHEHGIGATSFKIGNSHWHCPDRIISLLVEEKEIIRNPVHKNELASSNTNNDHLNPGVSSLWKPSMKEFYLVFSQTWLEYSIAGQTQSPTLVGIHGHVFDMTTFLEEHPGSPETIIMQGGGRDGTHFFESVGHSRKARSLALERLLEVVDSGCCSVSTLPQCQRRKSEGDERDHGHQYERCVSTSGYGDSSLKPSDTNGIKIVDDPSKRDTFLEDIASLHINVLPQKRSEIKRTPGTLYHTRVKLTREAQRAKLEARAKVTRQMSERGEMDILGNVNIYFDPLCYCWKGWYMNLDFQSVFVHDIRNVRQ